MDDGLGFVGSPTTLYRATSAVYADQARNNWDAYISATLAGSQAVGGRFNPQGEFGALYTADDEATAWEETAARWTREGVPGISADTQLLHIILLAGRYADLSEESVRNDFEVNLEALQSENPTQEQKETCWMVGRAVRSLADFLVSPSARAGGNNIPLYSDRPESELQGDFSAAFGGRVPVHLAQDAEESW